MDFFSAQQSAKRSTLLLIFLFLLAIVFLLALSNLFLFQYLYLSEYSDFTFSITKLELVYDKNLSLVLSISILIFIIIGSFYKLITLSSGGTAIAESLGGTIISRNSKNPQHKVILNVVEEMAIAAGMPVPKVYLLNERGINAFAAGWKVSNAVIGITQGALDMLSREELQGVIAHEFSHIFNGDMKINIRLIAILHSILMIGQIGNFALRSLRYGSGSRRSSNSKNGSGVLVILAIGLGMSIIGYTGTFFGNWIKSLISRQREFLADASAVQYTRNNLGIANALKKIGGASYGSMIRYASANEYSHGYFALSDLKTSFFSFSTHPPLKDRIKRIQPSWNGNFITVKNPYAEQDAINQQAQKEAKKEGLAKAFALNAALNNINNIGDINNQQFDLAKQWQQQIPDFIKLYSQEPSEARLLIYALLLDKDETIAKKQLAIIEQSQKGSTKTVKWISKQISQLEMAYDINTIDMALPSLQLMSLNQFKEFAGIMKKLIKADNKIDLNEWIIQRMLLQHLKEHYGLRKKALSNYFVLGSARHAIETTLSLLSYIDHTTKEQAEFSFNVAIKSIGASAFKHLDKSELTLKALDKAVDELEQLKPPLKKKFLNAATHCISHDGEIKKQSYEILRAIASCIDTPLPPIHAKYI